MAVGDVDQGGVVPGPAGEHDVQQPGGVGALHLDGGLLGVAGDVPQLVLRHVGDDLQDLVRPPGHHPGGHRRLDALQAAGVGDDDALHIFDDIAGHLRQHPLRGRAQGLPQESGGVGDGDGLCTAGGGDKLLPEDVHIGMDGLRAQHDGLLSLLVI